MTDCMCEIGEGMPLQIPTNFSGFSLRAQTFLPKSAGVAALFDQREQSTHFKMINAEGENVDLYIPRKCSWTNRLIEAKDHASVQINIGHLDQSGVYNGKYTTVALSGFVRNPA